MAPGRLSVSGDTLRTLLVLALKLHLQLLVLSLNWGLGFFAV